MKKYILPILICICLLFVGYSNSALIRRWFSGVSSSESQASKEVDEKLNNGIIDEEVLTFQHVAFEELRKSNSNEDAKISNLQRLYGRDVEEDKNREVIIPKTKSVNTAVSYTLVNSFVTEDYSMLEVKEDAIAPFEGYFPAYDDSGKKREGWKYLVLDVDIKNVGENDIAQFYSYGFAPNIYFLDEEGNLYYEVTTPNYCSYQSGITTQHAYYYADFKVGNSFSTRYVFTIPTYAMESKEMALVWNQNGNYDLPIKECSLVNLSDIQ